MLWAVTCTTRIRRGLAWSISLGHLLRTRKSLSAVTQRGMYCGDANFSKDHEDDTIMLCTRDRSAARSAQLRRESPMRFRPWAEDGEQPCQLSTFHLHLRARDWAAAACRVCVSRHEARYLLVRSMLNDAPWRSDSGHCMEDQCWMAHVCCPSEHMMRCVDAHMAICWGRPTPATGHRVRISRRRTTAHVPMGGHGCAYWWYQCWHHPYCSVIGSEVQARWPQAFHPWPVSMALDCGSCEQTSGTRRA